MFDQLKPIMQNGERYIVVEAGRPEYVVMRFYDYVGLISGAKNNPGRARAPEVRAADWEAANAELEAVRHAREDIRAQYPDSSELASAADPTTIRLEDLPL